MSDPTRPSQRESAGLLCPACRVALSMSSREGIEIDYCPNCRGVWLDRGELDKIIERSLAYSGGASAGSSSAEPPPMQPTAGYSQPWGAGHGGHDGGGRGGHGGGHGGSRHGRRRGFLGDLFD